MSGAVYNDLSEVRDDIYEFDLILNDKAICSYSRNRSKSYDVDVLNAVTSVLEYGNIQMPTEVFDSYDEAVPWLRKMLKKKKVFLFVRARLLDYDIAFRYSRNAKHIMCIKEYDPVEKKYRIADSFISNAPLASFYGWVNSETIDNSWIDLKCDNFYLDYDPKDIDLIINNRINNLIGFFEQYLNTDPSDENNEFYYGKAALNTLLSDTLKSIEASDIQDIEGQIVSLNYYFRADSVIGLSQLIRDSFQWLISQGDNVFWEECVTEMNSLIESLIKELLVCTKMSLRMKKDKVIASLQTMQNIIEQENNIYMKALNKLNKYYI